MKDPKTRNYQLWVDLYELIKCDVVSEGSPVWCIISIGRKESERQVAKPATNGKQYYWKWKKEARSV